LALTVDAVVQIGSAYWLRIPIGKLHNDRYIPPAPQLKEMLDDWVNHHRPAGLRTDRLLVERSRPLPALRVATALSRLAEQAGIGHVTANQMRHTLATQAINRGMSLDAIAALLGHKTLAMTMIYARIADKTAAEEYFSVIEKLGYSARPIEMDCHFESICESCTFFVTTIEFRPTLQAQRDDANCKGQVARRRSSADSSARPHSHHNAQAHRCP
jgi:integrase/recombinase XerD